MGDRVWEELFSWLDLTFNDFYQVYSPNDCELHIIEHKPTTSNEKFKEMLKRIYPSLDFETVGFGISDGSFLLYFSGKVPFTVEVQPFDNEIHHTEII